MARGRGQQLEETPMFALASSRSAQASAHIQDFLRFEFMVVAKLMSHIKMGHFGPVQGET